MLSQPSRLAFFIDDLYAGLAKASGLLRLEGEAIILEFQVEENLIGGLVKGQPKVFRMNLRAIESVELEKKWWWRNPRLILRVKRLRDLEGIPGSKEGEVDIKIRRQDREDAKAMVSRINLLLSEIRLADMDDQEY